jgi:hypothetical protein
MGEVETRLTDRALSAAAGVPSATLAAWLRRGHLTRPAAGWRVEDTVALRVAWLLSASGMEPAAALRLVDANRHAVWRGCGWLIAVRRHESDLFGGAAVSGEAVVLDRREDLLAILSRAAGSGADLTEVLLVDLAAAAEKCRLGLAHFNATRRPRGRPRKSKEGEE